MPLKKLFAHLEVKIYGNKNLLIQGLCSHSRCAFPNSLFIARKGEKFDGNLYIDEAKKGGAIAVLSDLYNPFMKEMVQVIHSHPEALAPLLANRYFHHPSASLFVMGITGTNGKTSMASLAYHFLSAKKSPFCGLIGTINTCIGLTKLPSSLTTPDAVTLQKHLREMVERHCLNVVLEVSSHALDQNRVEGVQFDAAVFTNFSQDHLDYHKTMEAYFQAKQKLFSMVDEKGKIAVLNRDDPLFFPLREKIKKAQVITYGIESEADFRARRLSFSLEGTTFLLEAQGKKMVIKTKLIGAFNVLNILGAMALGSIRGMGLSEMKKKLETFPGVLGRLQPIENQKGIHVFVDFAHTEEGLKKVLKTLQQIKKRNLITLFGCGGNRDRQKRFGMGRVVEAYSDAVVLTSDNPRMEDPYLICEEVMQGISHKKDILIEVDRKKAMIKALSLAQKEDIVLIAGRGHERFQEVGGTFHPFQDALVAQEICHHL